MYICMYIISHTPPVDVLHTWPGILLGVYRTFYDLRLNIKVTDIFYHVKT